MKSSRDRLRRASILHDWNLSEAELSEIVEQNPSLRGMLFGYVSEYKVRTTWFERDEFSRVKKYDDHDRSKKGDLSVIYKNTEIRIEVKGLQTNSVQKTGEAVQTTCLQVGEFDLLAVSLFHSAIAGGSLLPGTATSRVPYIRGMTRRASSLIF